jgi:hypothetical protein
MIPIGLRLSPTKTRDQMNNHPPADPGSQGRIAGMLQWLGSHELPVLLALCTILASLWGFAELAEEVMEGETHEFDQAQSRRPQRSHRARLG